MKTLLEIINTDNEPNIIEEIFMDRIRIEIHLTEEVTKAIQEKAEAQNHSRKSYIELLCINDVKKKTVKPKRNDSTDR